MTSLTEGLRDLRLCTVIDTTQRAIFPIHESKHLTTRGYDRWVKETYAKDSETKSPRLSYQEDNEVVDEVHEDGVISTLFKRKQPSGDDEVDNQVDRNFKYVRETEGTSPLNLSSGGDSFLQSNNEIFEEVGDFRVRLLITSSH
ncbi:hypothetical protein LIER_19369 [Lithospermum erythrorhizon]|uniref:Uncharacterized protein n=1 Tax=Lithospermum erythrorhizon TaxID=34254 RepID=A0AAV3QIF4_LITER